MEFGLNLYSLAGQIKTEEDFYNTLVKLKEIDPLSMSPMAALNFLYELKKDLK